MHNGDGHVTLFTASIVIYGMLFTNTVHKYSLLRAKRLGQTVFVNNIPQITLMGSCKTQDQLESICIPYIISLLQNE